MKLKLVIDRLKESCPVFSGRVAGAAELQAVLDGTKTFAMPHAFVLRAGGDAGPSNSETETLQVRSVEIAVAVALVNTADEKGFTAVEQVDDVDAQLLAALVGWDPHPSDGTDWPLEYVSDEHGEMNRARLIHVWHFVHRTQVAEA